MQYLAAAFNEPLPSGSLASLLGALDTLSIRWDFRARTRCERWEITEPDFPPWLTNAIYDASIELGLVEETHPLQTKYSAAAILGGARDSPLLRMQFTADLIVQQEVKLRTLYLLGSHRKVTPSERPFTDHYAPHSANEFDLMNAAAETILALSAHAETGGVVNGMDSFPCSEWRIRHYQPVGSLPVSSLSAPSSTVGRRTNTSDTYVWLNQHSPLRSGDTLLLITSAWFTAFQGFDAIRLFDLGHGIHSEIIGLGRRRAPHHVSPGALLQELRSGIRSAHQLYLAASG